ncbi:cystathionine gamma-synthase [Xylaria intraflava]|nr:cystathionine gamma-synthase [Xylaria intraflava]
MSIHSLTHRTIFPRKSVLSPPQLGTPVPDLPHAVSVQLPKWQDMIDFANHTERIANAQKGGYPRSFLHPDVQTVHEFLANKFGESNEACFVYPAILYATECQRYVRRLLQDDTSMDPERVRVQPFDLEMEIQMQGDTVTRNIVSIYAVFLPRGAVEKGMAFWRLTGTGISSRLAEDLVKGLETAKPYKSENTSVCLNKAWPSSKAGDLAYSTIRGRIAGLLERAPVGGPRYPTTSADDIYLYPTGMSAIYNLTRALHDWPGTKSVVFGFPYELTLKTQQDFAKDCVFYGFGTLSEMELLEDYLNMLMQQGSTIQAVWCECASNPLLRTVDLDRLRQLADRYGFLVIVDDTIASFANVDVLGVADIVVTSLTKSFSGLADVMGGCITLNPHSPFYTRLRDILSDGYSNNLYYRDAIKLEANSRDFLSRAAKMNENAARIVSFLAAFRDDPKTPLQRIYFPATCTWSCSNYEARMRPPTEEFVPGYGGLFTLDFETADHAAIFFDALDVCKGPSLGAEVTLAQPYVQTVFAKEKAWAARYGLRESIVRISVGTEDTGALLQAFAQAIVVLLTRK